MSRFALLLFSLGANVATLSGTATLSLGKVGGAAASPQFQVLNPNGSNRNVLLPALLGSNNGLWYVIRNSGTSGNLVVKSSDGVTTYATLAPGDWCWMLSSGGASPSWYVAFSTTTLTTLSLSGALSAAATTLTGRLTTTDGVASGDARVVGGNVYTKTSGTQVANTTTETTIGTYTLPANTLKAGTQIRVRGALRVAGVNGTPTITLRLKLGSTTYITSAALNVIADDVVGFDTVITGRATPAASAAVVAEGMVSATQSGTPATVQKVVAPANYATNGALAVAATIQWSAAHASNDLTCDSFSVDVVG